MLAKVNTKSNYRGLNGKWLEVKELNGRRVTLWATVEDLGRITIDFSIKEIEEFSSSKTQ